MSGQECRIWGRAWSKMLQQSPVQAALLLVKEVIDSSLGSSLSFCTGLACTLHRLSSSLPGVGHAGSHVISGVPCNELDFEMTEVLHVWKNCHIPHCVKLVHTL